MPYLFTISEVASFVIVEAVQETVPYWINALPLKVTVFDLPNHVLPIIHPSIIRNYGAVSIWEIAYPSPNTNPSTASDDVEYESLKWIYQVHVPILISLSNN